MRQSARRRTAGWVAFPAVMVLAAGSWGCARLPKTGTPSTGEPLKVEVHTESHSYVTQAKVGEVQHRDSSGRLVGTSSLYENQVGYYEVQRWQVFQGETPIDDQDFYNIAGDTEAAKQIAAYRAKGVVINRVGFGLLIAGGALALASLIVVPLASPRDRYGNVDRPAWTLMVGSGGLLMSLVGGTMAAAGRARAKREHPIDDPKKAEKAARRYNDEIGEQPDDDDERPRRKRHR